MPPLPRIGDQNPTDVYAAVGHAISTWEYLEGTLGYLYGVFVGDTRDASPALRAYGAVSAFGTRKDMISEAAKAYFFSNPASIEGEIQSLLDEAKQFATRRNEIAHGIMQPYYVGGPAPSGYVIGPSRYAVRKRKLLKHPEYKIDLAIGLYAYNSEIIMELTELFANLAQRTRDICVRLSSPIE
jgi:hypothetical protein